MYRSRIHAIFILIALGAITAGVLLLLRSHHNLQQYNKTLVGGATSIAVSIADTPDSQAQGLSDTASLPSNDGKLFAFNAPGKYGFWMKDMNYPLDFVWIDANMHIIGITSDVAADTYPQIFYPPQLAQYVLEVNANFSTTHNLFVGEQLTLQ